MENLIEAIRSALRDDAEPIAHRAGLVACRKVLAVLEAATDAEAPSSAPAEAPSSAPAEAPSSTSEAPSGMPTEAAARSPAPGPPIDPATVATLIASLGKLPPEQLLDLAISRLRAALPSGASAPAPAPLRFQLVPLHHLGRSK